MTISTDGSICDQHQGRGSVYVFTDTIAVYIHVLPNLVSHLSTVTLLHHLDTILQIRTLFCNATAMALGFTTPHDSVLLLVKSTRQ